MKIYGVALLLFLLMAPFALAQDNNAGRTMLCCAFYTSKAIPCRILKSYHAADGQCPLPATIFVTQRNAKICANPEDQWVQECQRRIDAQPQR
uniref:C-C motif chemokine 5-like n=1 Tax=Pogona vitticeps TaxID=103695 RepID=A0A6J0SJM6_9SAUR